MNNNVSREFLIYFENSIKCGILMKYGKSNLCYVGLQANKSEWIGVYCATAILCREIKENVGLQRFSAFWQSFYVKEEE